jgi:hypothetical protein
MKILLCLLSGQHVPNLLSVHHFAPDQLVLIETPAMRRQAAAENFLRALELGGQDHRQRCVVQPLESEDCLESVGRALREAFGRFPTGDWIVNLSGGTEPMSIAAYEFFKALQARLVYINAPRPSQLLGLDGRPSEVCDYRPSLVEFLTGGWLEVFLWGLLDRHQAPLEIWDVRLGMQFGKVGNDTDSELDIAFLQRHNLAIVECKSGGQEHDPGADVLHKLEAVVRQFRALRVTSYLATTSPNVWNKQQQIRPAVRNRAAIYACRILDRHCLLRLATSAAPAELLRESLFAPLDS